MSWTRDRWALVVAAAAISAAGLVGGCASSSASAGEDEENCVPAGSEGNRPGTVAVNTVCPIVDSDAADGSVTVAHQGKTIALCCAGCVRKFNAMTTAQRDAVLAKAMTYSK
ncbi:MAG: hypothetical protein HRU70_06940 [Phycisphaeraceae bacterium]|nr:MAG: hypothetical protein HRU70_06940 [Phycisphaeraceae bacterium]